MDPRTQSHERRSREDQDEGESAHALAPETAATVDARTSLATWLRDGRARRKLSIEDVAKITKIQVRILERLENGQFDGLPADVFVKGFVRSFAKCVGLDESEALDRYGAAQQGGVVVAQALVETMVPITQRKFDMFAQPSQIEPPAREAPLIEARVMEVKEPEPAAAPTVVAPSEAAPEIAAAPAAETPKPGKKRSRQKKTTSNQAPRSRRKKAATNGGDHATPVETIATTELEQIDSASPSLVDASCADSSASVIESFASDDSSASFASAQSSASFASAQSSASVETLASSIDTAPVAKVDIDADSTAIEAKSESGESRDVDVDDGSVDAPALAEGSQRISQQAIEVETATWQPTMPPIAATPSVPWRRPNLPTSTAYVVPTLVIDDADPDSADREREDRASKEPHRLSFLPPILLDREDRSARQGGLTLAVIILLIAATLTLSYLMRRPSPSGDGVTMRIPRAPSMLA